jgi:hypothetical protein
MIFYFIINICWTLIKLLFKSKYDAIWYNEHLDILYTNFFPISVQYNKILLYICILVSSSQICKNFFSGFVVLKKSTKLLTYFSIFSKLQNQRKNSYIFEMKRLKYICTYNKLLLYIVMVILNLRVLFG